jgi:hypothetical protein
MGDQAKTEFEVVDLVRTLTGYGVLTREDLFARSGAKHWARENFDAALREGVANGSIRQLSDDLFEVGEDAPELDSLA